MIRALIIVGLSLFAVCLLVVALLNRDPFFYEKRVFTLGVMVLAGVLTLLGGCLKRWGWVIVFGLISCVGLKNEIQFHTQKMRVLAAEPEALWRHGQHLIVGFRDPAMIELLVERQAIGGIFLTAKNVVDQSPKEFKAWIDQLQKTQQANGLPPLWIACDQEGGAVDRLSPPLPRGPALSSFVNADGSIDPVAIEKWGTTQASQLQQLGVNMNFSPVVDVPMPVSEQVDNPLDRFSRISTRAISVQPQLVGTVASHYSKGLQSGGVVSVAKHFPGLGKVHADTHLFPAHLEIPLAEWRSADAIPFKMLSQVTKPAVMMAHVNFDALDAGNPASVSPKVISLAREMIGPKGYLVTDDINMVPTYYRKGGVGKSTQDAIVAGVDWVLIAYRGETIYPVLDYLLRHTSAINSQDFSQSKPVINAASRKD